MAKAHQILANTTLKAQSAVTYHTSVSTSPTQKSTTSVLRLSIQFHGVVSSQVKKSIAVCRLNANFNIKISILHS